MGSNKRNITKDIIIYYLNNKDINPLVRDIKINQLFEADALIFDKWSKNFYNDLNPKEREIREKLVEKYRFSSGYDFITDEDYKSLKSLSESLISLLGTNPLWEDIFMVSNVLNINYHSDESGKFELMKEKCVKSIIRHFDE